MNDISTLELELSSSDEEVFLSLLVGADVEATGLEETGTGIGAEVMVCTFVSCIIWSR